MLYFEDFVRFQILLSILTSTIPIDREKPFTYSIGKLGKTKLLIEEHESI